jgi:hypothetical protein
MTGRAIKEFHVLRDESFERVWTDKTGLLPATMRASYDALARLRATSRATRYVDELYRKLS